MRAAGLAVLVLAGALAAPAGGSVAASGITGRVQASPTCPVETVPPGPGCAPRGIAVSLRVRRLGATASRTVRSGADGRFTVRVAPGTYVLTPLARSGSPYPRPPGSRRVRVRPRHLTYVTITYDTGIR